MQLRSMNGDCYISKWLNGNGKRICISDLRIRHKKLQEEQMEDTVEGKTLGRREKGKKEIRETRVVSNTDNVLNSQQDGRKSEGKHDSPISGIKARVIIIEDTGIRIIRKYF